VVAAVDDVLEHGAHENGVDAAVRERQAMDVVAHQRDRCRSRVEVHADDEPAGPTAAPRPTVTDAGPQPRSTMWSPTCRRGRKNAATESAVRRA